VGKTITLAPWSPNTSSSISRLRFALFHTWYSLFIPGSHGSRKTNRINRIISGSIPSLFRSRVATAGQGWILRIRALPGSGRM
jgi:hypothetical protein